MNILEADNSDDEARADVSNSFGPVDWMSVPELVWGPDQDQPPPTEHPQC